MNTNPINPAACFVLEITMLVAFACRWYYLTENWERYLLVLAFPAIAAALWGVFRIQNDPKPEPVEIQGILRLLLEFVLLGVAVWALYGLGYENTGLIIAIVVVIH
ncbi:DUF2568 domain-containing protein [uncultured Mucilaginibacter sp.]|uniref:DUF2568 domain-containing protein n=1 Tax=uncultured Mucilaginibacter sp. TaxID=797541 RepID=UPI0025F6B151|nr:DUF2568 domain-containing protein [uncultured Mucilaginibacter sp.]